MRLTQHNTTAHIMNPRTLLNLIQIVSKIIHIFSFIFMLLNSNNLSQSRCSRAAPGAEAIHPAAPLHIPD